MSRTPGGLPHLRILDVGGEALGADVVETWAPGRQLFNSYGPSEISVVCTGGYVKTGDVITIGAQLPTYQCYILDPETMEVKAEGERGVLFVGGVGLARGYLEEEEKTKAKFVELPDIGRVSRPPQKKGACKCHRRVSQLRSTTRETLRLEQ